MKIISNIFSLPDKSKDKIVCFFLFFVALFVLTQGLSSHGLEYRDDEIFYYKSTQEMLQNNDYLSPTYFGENRFQKPILFYWLIVVAFKLLGVNWFSARIGVVIFACLTVVLNWLLAKKLTNRRVAFLSSVILMTIVLFLRNAKNAVPDIPLNFFVVWAVYNLVMFFEDPSRTKYNVLFYVSCGLGFMIKGFAALIFPLLLCVVYPIAIGNPSLISQMKTRRGTMILLMIIAPWFIYMIVRHGQGYLDYMLVEETKNRLMGQGTDTLFWKKVTAFFDHLLFYGKVILSYFSPWSLFLLGAVPLAIKESREKRNPYRQSQKLLLIWMGTVIVFFSFMYFCINHYMLVLTTPFSILVSYFLLREFDPNKTFLKVILFAKKSFIVFVFTIGFFVFMFLLVFLAGSSKLWLIPLLCLYIYIMRQIAIRKDLIVAPLILGFFILFVFSQSQLAIDAGLTSHSALEKFAATLNNIEDANYIVGVGSNDVHEKEFQVYFNQKVQKAAHRNEEKTKQLMREFFAQEKTIYFLITDKDYKKYLVHFKNNHFDIIQQEDIMRKRMYIDADFFKALIRLDREGVCAYLKEKLFLVKRPHNV